MILTLKNDHLPWMFHIEIQKNFLKRTTVNNLTPEVGCHYFNSRKQIEGFFSSSVNESDNFTRKKISDYVVFTAQNFAPNWVVTLRVSRTVKRTTTDDGTIFQLLFSGNRGAATKHGWLLRHSGLTSGKKCNFWGS